RGRDGQRCSRLSESVTIPPRPLTHCRVTPRSSAHRPLPSFPTRRSSDLVRLFGDSSLSEWRIVVDSPGAIAIEQVRFPRLDRDGDRQSTRLNSSHVASPYAVLRLEKKRLHCGLVVLHYVAQAELALPFSE